MIDTLKLKNFKAYREEFEKLTNHVLKIDNKNFLLYGENGSGKSSIYEAIKVIFFKNKLERQIPSAPTPEEQETFRNDFWDKYKHKNAASAFELEINSVSYTSFDVTPYQTFMIAMDRLCIEDSIRLDTLLTKFDLSIENIDRFCQDHYETIQANVNTKLAEFREENITIAIDNEDDFRIKITDNARSLKYKENITKYFNEAKLNLIILLLLLESIQKAKDTPKTKILVLDDFITSLDVANRTFLMKHILDSFSDFQILIFTHNVYFYNLIMYLVNDIYSLQSRWQFANVYEIENQHRLYIKGGITTAVQIKKMYRGEEIKCDSCDRAVLSYNNSSVDTSDIGNKIRQRFEVLLYEFSKLLMVGAVEDSKKIMERIENSNNIYFNNKKIASDLIDEIETILNEQTPSTLQNRLKSTIQNYKKDTFQDFQKIVRNLKLYQKVALHPMSHGTYGQNTFTTTDIEQSLDLLEKFENYIKDFIGSNADGA